MVNKKPELGWQWPLVGGRRRSWVILGASFFLGLAFYYCFWDQLPGISTFVYFVVATAVCWVVCRVTGIQWNAPVWIVAGAIGVLSLLISLRTSQPMFVLNGLAILALGLIAVWYLRGGPWRMQLSNYAILAFLPIFWVVPFFETVIVGLMPARSTDRRLSQAAIKGIVLTVPLVLILLLLFISSDPRLGALIDNIFTFSFSAELVAIWFVILSVSIWFSAALAYAAKRSALEYRLVEDRRLLGATESRIMLIGVVAVFALYLLSQAYYLFGGEAYLADNALTYADYARQGFAQLVMASLIAGGVIWATKPYLSQEDKRLKELGVILAVLVLVILASAGSRLWLYEQAYGFTYARIIAHAFMVWLASIFAILIWQIRGRLEGKVAGPAIVAAAVVILLGLNGLNPDAFIARQNIARYHSIGKIDMNYIRVLSDDAVPVVANLLDAKDPTLRTEVSQYLLARSVLSPRDALDWQSWNASRQRATAVVEQVQKSPNFNPSGPVGKSRPQWQD